MSLQYQVEAIPEGMEQFYQEKEGKFVLAVEGLPQVDAAEVTELKSKLAEFRDNNRALHAQVQKYTGAEAPQVEELVKQAVAANTQKLTVAEQTVATLQAQLEEVIISDKLKEAAIKYGVAETAIQDVLNRGKSSFVVKDGKPLPKNGGVDADGNVLSPETWVKALTAEAPHLFKPSQGAGAKRPLGTTTQNSGVSKILAGLNELSKK